MPTNSRGSVARNGTYQNIQYLRKGVTLAEATANATQTIGVLPAGAIVVAPISGVDVQTVFNAGTNNRVNIGIAGTTAKYATNSSLLALGFVAMGVAAGHRVATDTTLIATFDLTGTAATTGEVEIVVAFVLDNDK